MRRQHGVVQARQGPVEQWPGGEAIESYLKAEDATDYSMVIPAAESGGFYDDLVRFLLMARKSVKDQYVDTELVYSYAKTGHWCVLGLQLFLRLQVLLLSLMCSWSSR